MSFLYLAPDDAVDPVLVAAIAGTLAGTFRLPVREMRPTPLPSYAYDEKRQQYSSVLILQRLIERIPPDAARIVAVTECDLFIPMLTFVFGQAQLNGPAALVSLARLRSESCGRAPDHSLLLDRSRKEAVHELGHCFGLTHCEIPVCVMSLSTTIQQVDQKTRLFCSECRALLDESIARLPAASRLGGAP